MTNSIETTSGMKYIDSNGFCDVMIEHHHYTSGVGGKRGDFSGVSFHKMPKLSNYVFIDVDFSGADLSTMDLSNSIFIKCDCKDVNFFEAKIENVSFNDSDLTGACFNETSIINSFFINTNLSGADLNLSKFYDCNLNSAKFDGADLTDSYFLRCWLCYTSFKEVFVNGCVIKDSNLRESKFENVGGYTLKVVDCDYIDSNVPRNAICNSVKSEIIESMDFESFCEYFNIAKVEDNKFKYERVYELLSKSKIGSSKYVAKKFAINGKKLSQRVFVFVKQKEMKDVLIDNISNYDSLLDVPSYILSKYTSLDISILEKLMGDVCNVQALKIIFGNHFSEIAEYIIKSKSEHQIFCEEINSDYCKYVSDVEMFGERISVFAVSTI